MNRSTRNRNLLSNQRQLSTGLGKASLFIVGLLLVAGCGNQPSTPSSTSATSSAHEIVEPVVTETEKEPTTTEQESSTSATTDSSSATSTVTDNDTDISGTTILEAANKGTLPDLPEGLSLGSSRSTLVRLQGKPELGGTEGPMLSYGTLDVTFDANDQIVEFTSGADAYKKLKIDTVIANLGKTAETNDTSKDIAYTAEATYHLTNPKFPKSFLIFSYNTQSQHINYVRLYTDIQ
ncbi:hypothetical protein PQ456_06420 [Paenibacillus kyungheensis]|uniref:DUF4309 domain-containing protein n=1 Tax=Paenibacillus kyungheensis TaxID=1452732 RepID=A0AAX3M4F2_9BACL|nr:hypothetical protein [Paenibacillus kyungheensis]WCT57144.1 hypothetical protein PQ456_06420 [Paenibacillus kyungheensis]